MIQYNVSELKQVHSCLSLSSRSTEVCILLSETSDNVTRITCLRCWYRQFLSPCFPLRSLYSKQVTWSHCYNNSFQELSIPIWRLSLIFLHLQSMCSDLYMWGHVVVEARFINRQNFDMSGDQWKNLADVVLNYLGEASPKLQAFLLMWKEQYQSGKAEDKVLAKAETSRKNSKASLKVGPSYKRLNWKTPSQHTDLRIFC